MTVTAAAISGILKKAGFKRARTRGTSWSSGVDVCDFGRYVRIGYSAVNRDQQLQTLEAMAAVLNGRPNKKYWAQIEPIVEGGQNLVVKVYAYDETDPAQNEARKAIAMEKLAEGAPDAPAVTPVLTVKGIETALGAVYSIYSSKVGGFAVHSYSRDRGALRVEHYDGIGQGEQKVQDILRGYSDLLTEAGYRVVVDYRDSWALLVTLGDPEETARTEDDPQEVREALLKLWEGVEWDLAYVTRRAGNHSIFVIDPYGQKTARRVEVFYSAGEYKTRGRFSQGQFLRFQGVTPELLHFIRSELSS